MDLGSNRLNGPFAASWWDNSTMPSIRLFNVRCGVGWFWKGSRFEPNCAMPCLLRARWVSPLVLDPIAHHLAPGASGPCFADVAPPSSPPRARSNNLCLCGGLPPWLSAGWAYAWNTSLYMPCDSAPYECSPVLPASWYLDNGPLLDLKAQLGVGQNYSLESWTPYRPACTSTNATGNCTACTWADSRCGVARASDGALLCNWRFVSCRSRRVVGLHFSNTVGCGGCGVAELVGGAARGVELQCEEQSVRLSRTHATPPAHFQRLFGCDSSPLLTPPTVPTPSTPTAHPPVCIVHAHPHVAGQPDHARDPGL